MRGDAYYQLLDEFLTAVRRRYGNTTLIHFSDMAYDNAAKLLNMYRTDFPCFSDELQVRGWPGGVGVGGLPCLPCIAAGTGPICTSLQAVVSYYKYCTRAHIL